MSAELPNIIQRLVNLKKRLDAAAPPTKWLLLISDDDEKEFGDLVPGAFEMSGHRTREIGKEVYYLLNKTPIDDKQKRRIALERFIKALLEIPDLKVTWDAAKTDLTGRS